MKIKILFTKIILLLFVLTNNSFSKALPPGSGIGDVPANVLILLDKSGSMGARMMSGAGLYYPYASAADSSGNVYVGQYYTYGIKKFDYAIVDMRLEDGSGLELIKKMKEKNPNTKPLLLTGYGNIATAVAAIKSGAIDYLPKPAEVDQIYDALTSSKDMLPPPPENPMSADRIRWEHIQRVFIQCNRNVSETARRLRMHRRTLQRILNKHAPKE